MIDRFLISNFQSFSSPNPPSKRGLKEEHSSRLARSMFYFENPFERMLRFAWANQFNVFVTWFQELGELIRELREAALQSSWLEDEEP